MIHGKALYTPKGAALEYGRVGCNFYTGCPNECEYCFLKRGAPSKQLGGTQVRLKKCFKDVDNALEIWSKEVRKHIDTLRETGVFFSFTTDPLIPETRDLTLSAIAFLSDLGIASYVLTKNHTFYEYDRFTRMLPTLDKELVHFGFTFTGRDDMEPKASRNSQREFVLRCLHDQGYKTWASIEPVVDWDSSCRMIARLIDVCDHFKVGLRSGVGRDYYDPQETLASVKRLTTVIPLHGGTVYLKQSVRTYMNKVLHLSLSEFEEIVGRTVDMYGKPFLLYPQIEN
jgi:DNA repair photolyase